MVASTRGAEPERTFEASSPMVASRTQCRPFSLPQWPLLAARRLGGSARS